MPKRPKVSIIIVHYRNKEALYKCLTSILKHKPKVSFEVIVVDNDEKKSIEKSLKRKFSRVTYVKAPGNIGYASGNNLGVGEAKGEYLFILNPDTEVLSGSVDKLVRFIGSENRTGIVAPTLVDRNSKIYPLQGTKQLTPLRGIVALSFINKLFPNNFVSKAYWLKDISKDEVREVEVVPGSAFLIKKSVFGDVGRFDENFFLYFEESDLGKRVKEAGYKIYMIPQAKIIHTWGGTTPKSEKINEIFRKSRFYYFKKHYGLFSALLVEGFLRINKKTFLLSLIILVAAFLRFYRIKENLVFHGELGYDYLAVRDILEGNRTPLLGPPTSHPWLSISPLFYWIFAVLLPLGNWHPIGGAYFMAVGGVAAVYLSYFVVKKFQGDGVGLLTSYLLAISPAWIELTRNSRFNSVSALLFFPYFYFLIKSLENKGKSLFWVGIFLGLMYNFFPTIVVLLPVTLLILFIKRASIKLKSFWDLFIGVIIPNIPFLIYNLLNQFEMIFKLSVWVPYRILGFLGLYPKNTANLEIIKANFVSLYVFFRESWFPEETVLAVILFWSVLGYLSYKIFKGVYKKDNFWFALILIFVVSYIALFLHGDPPKHYYLVMFPLPIIITANFLKSLLKSKLGTVLSLLILLLISVYNLRFYFSQKWFFVPQDKATKDNLPVPFNLQESIVSFIIKDADGRKFSLKRVGPLDHFEDYFAQNYIYLLWRGGNEPVENAILTYSIYENTENLPHGNTFWVGNIAIQQTKND